MNPFDKISNKLPFIAQLTVLAVVLLVVLSPVLSLSGMIVTSFDADKYENDRVTIELNSVSDSSEASELYTDQMVTYTDLSEEEQSIVDRTISNDEIIVMDKQDVSDTFQTSKTMTVEKDNSLYTLQVRLSSTNGMLVADVFFSLIGLFLSGLVSAFILMPLMPILVYAGVCERHEKRDGDDEYEFVLFKNNSSRRRNSF